MTIDTDSLVREAMEAAERAHDAQVLATLLTRPTLHEEEEIGGEWSLPATDLLLNQHADAKIRVSRVRVRATRFLLADDDTPAGYVMLNASVWGTVLTKKGEPSKAESPRWWPVTGNALVEAVAQHFLGESLTALKAQP